MNKLITKHDEQRNLETAKKLLRTTAIIGFSFFAGWIARGLVK